MSRNDSSAEHLGQAKRLVIFVIPKRKDMEKFTKLTEPEEVDLFTIYEENGKKYIRIYGYTWFDYPDEGEYGWHLQEYDWFVEELGEFIGHLTEDEDYVDHLAQGMTQYIADMPGETMTNLINSYFGGEPADAYLGFEQITMDTPCGNYC